MAKHDKNLQNIPIHHLHHWTTVLAQHQVRTLGYPLEPSYAGVWSFIHEWFWCGSSYKTESILKNLKQAYDIEYTPIHSKVITFEMISDLLDSNPAGILIKIDPKAMAHRNDTELERLFYTWIVDYDKVNRRLYFLDHLPPYQSFIEFEKLIQYYNPVPPIWKSEWKEWAPILTIKKDKENTRKTNLSLANYSSKELKKSLYKMLNPEKEVSSPEFNNCNGINLTVIKDSGIRGMKNWIRWLSCILDADKINIIEDFKPEYIPIWINDIGTETIRLGRERRAQCNVIEFLINNSFINLEDPLSRLKNISDRWGVIGNMLHIASRKSDKGRKVMMERIINSLHFLYESESEVIDEIYQILERQTNASTLFS